MLHMHVIRNIPSLEGNPPMFGNNYKPARISHYLLMHMRISAERVYHTMRSMHMRATCCPLYTQVLVRGLGGNAPT